MASYAWQRGHAGKSLHSLFVSDLQGTNTQLTTDRAKESSRQIVIQYGLGQSVAPIAHCTEG